MTTLAIDTATDRCSIAVGTDTALVERHVDGARRHATTILSLISDACSAASVMPRDVQRIVIADGPGSFTGLRVAASVAKAMAWGRRVEWRTAPSLLVRAAPHAPSGGGTVMALSDALRGEVYAGCWTITDRGVTCHAGLPRAMQPSALAGCGPVDVLVGAVPDTLRSDIERVTGRTIIDGEAGLPDARTLVALAAMPGGTALVTDIDGWEPDYGRPAEAQAVWERKHGRPLPSPAGIQR